LKNTDTPEKNAVKAPISATKKSTLLEYSKIPEDLINKKTPAVTIVAA